MVETVSGDNARRRLESLTRREAEVLLALMEGKQVRQLAVESYLSENTIRFHISSVLRKLGVHSQIAAVALARRGGWPEGRDDTGENH